MTKIDIKVDTKRHRNAHRFEKNVLSKFPKTVNEKRKKLIKTLSIVFSVFLMLLAVIGVWGYYKLYLPAMRLKDQAYSMLDEVNIAKNYFESQDLVSLQNQIPIVETELEEFISQYEYFSFAEKLPIAKGYYANGTNLLEAARLSIPLGQSLLTAATPIADVFGYKTTDGEQEEVAGQEKIETIIRNLPDISSVLEESDSQVDQILDALSRIDPKYIPEKVGDMEIGSKFEEIDFVLKESKNIFADVQEVLQLVPSLAGADGKKTYLILFQNDMEIRPTGGFITAFGYAEIENGVLGDIVSEDIYNLDRKIYSWEKAPKEIQEYLGVYEWHIRDVNIHADLVSASQKFEEMYANQYRPRDFDGIVYLDTGFVESLISVVGPIELKKYNETITAENVVHELEIYSEKILTGGADRKQFMEDLMGELISRVIEARSEEWGGLISGVWSSLETKSLQFYFHNEDVQSLASKYGFTGEVNEDVDGDFLYVVESNMGGLKSNIYVTSAMTQNIQIDDDGSVTKTVKIRWENPEPKDFWLNGPYRNWVRVYVPKGSELIGDGVWTRTPNEDWNEKDYGKTIFESFVTVPVATGCSYYDKEKNCEPGVAEIVFTYRLPFTVDKKEPYSLFIQKQPGRDDEPQTIIINDETFEEVLNRDLELML